MKYIVSIFAVIRMYHWNTPVYKCMLYSISHKKWIDRFIAQVLMQIVVLYISYSWIIVLFPQSKR